MDTTDDTVIGAGAAWVGAGAAWVGAGAAWVGAGAACVGAGAAGAGAALGASACASPAGAGRTTGATFLECLPALAYLAASPSTYLTLWTLTLWTLAVASPSTTCLTLWTFGIGNEEKSERGLRERRGLFYLFSLSVLSRHFPSHTARLLCPRTLAALTFFTFCGREGRMNGGRKGGMREREREMRDER